MRCLYQNTPDIHMILGLVPGQNDIALACGFSGSGFQFAPAIALFMADLVLDSEDEKAQNEAQLTHNAHKKTEAECFDLFATMRSKYDPARFGKDARLTRPHVPIEPGAFGCCKTRQGQTNKIGTD